MPKKNILFLSNELYEGGSEEVIFNLARNLDTRKFNTYVAGLYYGPILEVFRNYGINVLKLSGKDKNERFKNIKKYIYELKINCILCNYLPYGHFFVPAGVKTVEVVHSPYPWLIDDKIYHEALRRSERVVCVSRLVYNYMLSHFKNLKSKMIVIENGIDENKIKPVKNETEVIQKYNIPEDSIIVGSLGRICPEKGVERIIEIARILNEQHQNLSFIVAGDYTRHPSFYNSIKDKINQYKLPNVIFTGYIKNAADLLQIYDIFIFPSYHDEGLQLALLEALKIGLPVVTTNVGVVTFDSDMKDGKIGYIVDDYSAELFSKKINDLIKNPDLRKGIGRYNLKVFSGKYLISEMVNQYEEMIIEITN